MLRVRSESASYESYVISAEYRVVKQRRRGFKHGANLTFLISRPYGETSETPPSHARNARMCHLPLEGEVSRRRKRGYSQINNVRKAEFISAVKRNAIFVPPLQGEVSDELCEERRRGHSKITYVARRVSRRSKTQFAHTCASAVSLRELRQGSASLAQQGEFARLYAPWALMVARRGTNNALLQTAHTRCLRIVR